MPYLDVPTTQHFRHTWVIAKRPRPVSPLFIGSPVPQKRDDASERSAILTMTYFVHGLYGKELQMLRTCHMLAAYVMLP